MTKALHQSTLSWNFRDKDPEFFHRGNEIPDRDLRSHQPLPSHFRRWTQLKNLFKILGGSVSCFSIHTINKFDNCTYLATSFKKKSYLGMYSTLQVGIRSRMLTLMSQISMRTNPKVTHSYNGNKLPLFVQCSLIKENKKMLEENHSSWIWVYRS